MYGFEEIFHNWRGGAHVAFQASLRALGYVDVLVVPTAVLERYVLPHLPARYVPAPLPTAETTLEALSHRKEAATTALLETLVEGRFINGTATMMINLDRCTRCDDCIRACAAAHDNNPRFIRHGPRIGRFMVANACMHCADPVCMIGCPTGAIHRNPDGGQVIINDATCIGCATCANSCPYENIRMVEIRDRSGAFMTDSETRRPIVKATKCDLCVDQMTGPACENACPHDALRRLDMHELEGVLEWMQR
jgi:Fe-S-cluster-containing dehydrogenase component